MKLERVEALAPLLFCVVGGIAIVAAAIFMPELFERSPLHERVVELDDGRAVTCVVTDGAPISRGGVDCDWGNR